MKTLVMKFGGASVATPVHLGHVADLIIQRKKTYQQLIVVISAMGDTTNQLIALARQINENPPQREYDMLVSVGERISMSLLAMALAKKHQQAVSFTGSQSGIITCSSHGKARIIDLKPHRLLPHLEEGKIVIVAGFQGVSRTGEITTLGRDGSDTSAVALAIAFKAEKVELYKAVAGIYAEDPHINPSAAFFKKLTYDEALEISKKGAKILPPRCIILAKNHVIPLHIYSFNQQEENQTSSGTLISQTNLMPMNKGCYEEEEIP